VLLKRKKSLEEKISKEKSTNSPMKRLKATNPIIKITKINKTLKELKKENMKVLKMMIIKSKKELLFIFLSLKRERKNSIPKYDVNIKDKINQFSQKKKEEEPIPRKVIKTKVQVNADGTETHVEEHHE